MATKAEERKALEKIRNIVEGLGEDSYIGMAFEGCFEVAESNIDNDFADSWMHRAERYEAMLNDAENGEWALQGQYNQLKEDMDEMRAECAKLTGDCDAWREKARERKEYGEEMYARYREQEVRAVKLEEETIKLKAKLYDLITAE